ncbi:MAG: amylo-alpha-1,6-glucosidase [Alphaproteobacteria bacterium]
MSQDTLEVPDVPSDRFGRDVCANLAIAEHREWLVTNGIGGYASGTVSGNPTRGYHGILVAALDPPLGRTVKLVTVLETVRADDDVFELGTVRWRNGSVSPSGYGLLEEFRLEGSVPAWRYASGRFTLEKRIFMDNGANTTRIEYANLWSDVPLRLSLKLITDHRDYHSRTFAGSDVPAISVAGDVLSVAAPGGSPAGLFVRLAGGRAEGAGVWYRDFDLARERDRGLTDSEDHLFAGTLSIDLDPGATVQLVASIGAAAPANPTALDGRRRRDADLLAVWRAARNPALPPAPDWVERLVLAADQFVVGRRMRDGSPGHSVIAGYHWFSDWGRDTMISLPGLAIETGRFEVARSILLSFAEAVDGGMIPNRYPDLGETPEFNTVDATFWFIDAVRAYHAASRDDALLAQLFSTLKDIIERHVQGTRYGIRMDPADGLIRAGEPETQLTWMDARVGDWVVTPRIGKPIEVNALWCSALRFIADAAAILGKPTDRYASMADRAAAGFQRFWNPARGFCFDVLDGPDGDDPTLRPNQIFAASLPTRVLPNEQLQAVVRICERALLTPAGLRSLAAGEPGYTPSFGGGPATRDAAYHRGTVWAWLIGPFIEAHLNVFGDRDHVERILQPMRDQLRIEGLGTINEIFEAEPPYAPRGCIAQAWSVAAILRAYGLIERFKERAGDASAPVVKASARAAAE